MEIDEDSHAPRSTSPNKNLQVIKPNASKALILYHSTHGLSQVYRAEECRLDGMKIFYILRSGKMHLGHTLLCREAYQVLISNKIACALPTASCIDHKIG